MNKSMNNQSFAILSRVLAAIIGGYLLANLVAIVLSYLLPSSPANGVMTGMLVSYLIYTAVVMWVFTAKTLRQVWLGLILCGTVCAILIAALMPEGLL